MQCDADQSMQVKTPQKGIVFVPFQYLVACKLKVV